MSGEVSRRHAHACPLCQTLCGHPVRWRRFTSSMTRPLGDHTRKQNGTCQNKHKPMRDGESQALVADGWAFGKPRRGLRGLRFVRSLQDSLKVSKRANGSLERRKEDLAKACICESGLKAGPAVPNVTFCTDKKTSSFLPATKAHKRRPRQCLNRLSVCLSACLLACLPVCLAICLSGCLSVCLSVCACLSVCLAACLVCLSGCPFVSLFVCLSVCLSACLPAGLPACMCCGSCCFRKACGGV